MTLDPPDAGPTPSSRHRQAAEVAKLEREVRELSERAQRAEAALRVQAQELASARADVEAIQATRRYKIGAAIARPLDRLRARRARGRLSSASGLRAPVPFIVGVPRSGTTLLRLMLNAHSQLAIPPETLFITALAVLPTAGDVRRAFFDAITNFDTWPDLGIEDQQLATVLRRVEPFDVGNGVRAVYRLYAARFGKPRFGDKTPNYALHTREIRGLLPEARFIHIVRDGRDVAVSVRPLWFRPGDTIEELACDWKRRIEMTRRDCEHDDGYLELRYEDLVANPEAELRRICDFLELRYERGMARFWETSPLGEEEFRPYTAPDGSVLASSEGRRAHFRRTATPPAPERIGRWRDALTADEIARFEHVAGGLLDALGYERHSGEQAPR